MFSGSASSVLCGHAFVWSRENKDFRGEHLSVLEFNKKCLDYMIVDWNEGNINKDSSVKYVSWWSGGRLVSLGSILAIVTSTVEAMFLPSWRPRYLMFSGGRHA